MKQSIGKVFVSINLFITMVFIASVGLVYISIEQSYSYAKINNLQNQKVLASSLMNINKSNIDIAIIKCTGASKQLKIETDKLRLLEKYDYTGQYLFEKSSNFIAELDILASNSLKFTSSAKAYYELSLMPKAKKRSDKIKRTELEKKTTQELNNSFYTLTNHLEATIYLAVKNAEEKFVFFQNITYFLIVMALLLTLLSRIHFYKISKDIAHLHAVDADENYKAYLIETQQISQRMLKRPIVVDDPAMIDRVTQLNNYQGLFSSFERMKNLKDKNILGIAVMEIDNFSKQNRPYSEEFTQSILKKVASCITLYKQSLDVAARTDYNQFTVVFSRTSKDKASKDVQNIRKSISEIKLRIDGAEVPISVSGGFIVKSSSKTLETTLQKAKVAMEKVKDNGGDNIKNAAMF